MNRRFFSQLLAFGAGLFTASPIRPAAEVDREDTAATADPAVLRPRQDFR